MVSLIQSITAGWVAGIVVPGLRVMFQDRVNFFNGPQHANVYAPGKRPFHTIIPGFVDEDAKPWETFGVMGGGCNRKVTSNVLTNQIDFGLERAGSRRASRWQHEGDNEPTGEKMTQSGGYVEKSKSGIVRDGARMRKKKVHDVRFDVGLRRLSGIKVEKHDGPARSYVGARRIAQGRRWQPAIDPRG